MRAFRNFAVVGVLVTAICILVVSAVGWYNGESAIDDAIRNELVTRRANRATQVADQVQQIGAEIAAMAADPSIERAASDLIDGMDKVESSLASRPVIAKTEGDLAEWMQSALVDPMNAAGVETLPAARLVPEDPIGQEMAALAVLGRAGVLPPAYVRAVEVHGSALRQRAEVLGFDDILVVDIDSRRVVLSSAGSADAGADLNGGYLRSSGLADVVRLASDGGTGVAVADYSAYLPARNRAAAFFAVAMPMRGRGPIALVARVSPEPFNRLLIDARGLAPSGLTLPVRTYVVGSDRLLRTDPVVFQQDPERYTAAAEAAGADERTLLGLRAGQAALAVSLDTPLVDDLFIREESAVGFTTDPIGREVLLGVEKVPTDLVDWAVVAQINRSEALEPIRRFAIQEAILGVLVLFVAGVVLSLINRSLFRPKARLEHVAARILEGDFSERVGDEAGDEISAAAGGLDRLIDTVVEADAAVETAEREAAAIPALVMPASIDLTDGAAGQSLSTTDGSRRVTCCLVADASAAHASDLQTVDAIREAMSYVRSLAVSHGVFVERIEGSSVLVSAPEAELGAIIAFARDSVAAGGSGNHEEGTTSGLLSAGIGMGDLAARVVGTRRIHVVVWGSAVESAEEAQERAVAGHVALSTEAARLARTIGVADVSDGPMGASIATLAAGVEA